MQPTYDITGLRSGRLVAIKRVPSNGGAAMWLARCDCGSEIVTSCSKLRTHHTKSCGCFKRDRSRKSLTTHNGKSEHPRLYRIWMHMRSRCNNTRAPMFYRYGARGIKLCPQWDDFATFRDWALSSGYRDDLSIERDDNDKNYEPSNCRWIPLSEQAGNRSMNTMVEYRGVTQCVAYHARDIGVDADLVRSRLRAGWDVVTAFEKAPNPRQSQNIRKRWASERHDG